VTADLPDDYFDALYAESSDPWELASRWYERRKYAITLALLPQERYDHAFEPGCSIGVLTELLSARCDRVTATDVADAALAQTDARLRAGGHREGVTLLNRSFDTDWPATDFDLVMISELAYYFDAATPGLQRIGGYADEDVSSEIFHTGSAQTVAARTGVPGAEFR
jgi:protein-L-isoaspartate O-methyltransferase